MHKRGAPDSKLKFGPLWDFDLSAGNDDGVKDASKPAAPDNDNGNWCPQGWFTRWVSSDYAMPMLNVPEFKRLAEARWEYLSSRLPDLQAYIDQASANMADAQARNFAPDAKASLEVRVWPNWVVLPTYQEEVDYLKLWLQERADWMDIAIPAEAVDYDQKPLCPTWLNTYNAGWIPGASPSP